MSSVLMETSCGQSQSGRPDQDDDYPPEVSCLLMCVMCNTDLRDASDAVEKAKLLLCFHSVCHKCVASWQSNDIKICPLCYHPNKLNDVHENKVLQELVAESNSDPNGMCQMHEDLPVIKYCKDCKQAVCQKCIESHPMLLITRNHAIVELSDMPLESPTSSVEFNCLEHPLETLNIFCSDCDTIVCRDCILSGSHKQHQYEVDIAAQCMAVKKDLLAKKARLTQIRESLKVSDQLLKKKKEESLAQKVAICKELDECSDCVIETLKKKFKNLKFKLSTMVGDDIRKIDAISTGNGARKKPLNHVLEVIDLLTQHVSDNNVMYTRRHFTKCFTSLLPDDLLTELPDCSVKRTYKLDNMEPLFQELANYLRKLGDVITVLEGDGEQGESGQPIPSRSGQTTPTPPVRLRPTGDLQSPDAREPNRRISQDSTLNISEAASSSGVPHVEKRGRRPKKPPTNPCPQLVTDQPISWHTPQQPPAKPTTASNLQGSHVTLANMLGTTISIVQPSAITPPITPPVTQFSSATITSARQDPVQSLARRLSNATATHSQNPGGQSTQQQNARNQRLLSQQQQQQQQLQQQHHQQQPVGVLQQQLQQPIQHILTPQQHQQPYQAILREQHTTFMFRNGYSTAIGSFQNANQPHAVHPSLQVLQNNDQISIAPYTPAPGQQQQQQQPQPADHLQSIIAYVCPLCRVSCTSFADHLFECPLLADVRNQFSPDEIKDSRFAKLCAAARRLLRDGSN